MKLYKLKKEAVPFFKDEYKSIIKPLEVWARNRIEIQALQEVPPVYLTFGFKKGESNYLCGWDSKDGGESHFHFTIHVPLCTHNEHEDFKSSGCIRVLMDKLTPIIEDHFNRRNESSNHQ